MERDFSLHIIIKGPSENTQYRKLEHLIFAYIFNSMKINYRSLKKI